MDFTLVNVMQNSHEVNFMLVLKTYFKYIWQPVSFIQTLMNASPTPCVR